MLVKSDEESIRVSRGKHSGTTVIIGTEM